MRSGIIWMLHRVAPADEKTVIFALDTALRISPDFLEIQILRCLENGYRFVSMDTFLENKATRSGSATDICITIDDGFKDIFQYAFPVFKKYDIPFLFYISTDFINHGFMNCPKPEADGMLLLMNLISTQDSFDLSGEHIPAHTFQEKQKAFNTVWQLYVKAKEASPQKTGIDIFKEFFPAVSFDFEASRKEYLCSWEEINEMASHPLCTIGSHASTHQWLSLIKDETLLEKEFSESKRILEEKTGKPVNHMSYPYGQHNEKARQFAKKYFESATTIQIGEKISRRFTKTEDDNYTLPRISIQENNALPLFTGKAVLALSETCQEKWSRRFKRLFSYEVKGNKKRLRVFGLKITLKKKD